MYAIYSDGSLIYSPNLIEHGYLITDGKITKELNKAGSLEFTIPKTNPMYSSMSKLKSIITVEDYGKEIWRGRILDETTDFYGNKKIFCEGELAFLNDGYGDPIIVDRTRSLSAMMDEAMTRYNSICSDYRVIKRGNIVPTSYRTHYIIASVEEPTNLLDWLQRVILDFVGGYFIVERRDGVSYLDYYQNFDDRVLDQVIEFGKNLIDFEEYIDASEVYTYLLPLGKKDDSGKRVDITSVNGNKNYISSSSGEALFGKIWRVVIFDDISSPSSLLSKANEELNKAIESAITITIKAVDLKDLGVDCSKIDIGWMIPVVSIPHDIYSNALCSKVILDLSDRGNNEYTLGMNFSSLSDRQSSAYKKSNQTYLMSSNNQSDLSNFQKNVDGYKNSIDENMESFEERIKILEEKLGIIDDGY